MKTRLLAIALILGAPVSSPALASESSKVVAPTKDLVAAAKEAKSRRKKPETKVLTNADVRKSKGTLIELKPAEGEVAAEPSEQLPPLELHDEQRRQRIELEEKILEVRKTISALERELELIEQRYYEENDPDRRDKLIRPQFEEKKKELDAARVELDTLQPAAQVKTEEAPEEPPTIQ